MKIHNDFTLYWRVFPSGARVVYYHAYDETGKRLFGKSTGETTMTAARVKCNRLFKEGKLTEKKAAVPTFGEYAQGWWEWDTCGYLKKRLKRTALTPTYASNNKKNLKNHLLPFFGGKKMDKIGREDIEKFFDFLIEKDYQNTTINGIYGTLKTMLIEAAARKVIVKDPTEKIGRLVNDRREIKIIKIDEFHQLFSDDWVRVWEDDRICYTANKLAALTGMRSSEVLGLKGRYVYDEHIFVCKQYDEYGYRDTKTKDRNNIVVAGELMSDLHELKRMNGEGFLFSLDGGATPIHRKTLYKKFHRALRNIGLSENEIAERHLHLHAWRHFANTELLRAGLTISQTQAITRHKSARMTEMYSHFNPSDFAKAKEVQEALLNGGVPGGKGRAEGLKLVKRGEDQQSTSGLGA